MPTQGTQRKPTAAVDLQGISFHQGGHLMANAKVKLPEGAQRIEAKVGSELQRCCKKEAFLSCCIVILVSAGDGSVILRLWQSLLNCAGI